MESMESFEFSIINLRIFPMAEKYNCYINQHLESEDNSGKVSKLAALYTEKDTPISKKFSHAHRNFIHFILSNVLSLNMKQFFHYLLQWHSYNFFEYITFQHYGE
jgi:hypothetical protein